jgi:hypothetical protein
VKYLNELVRPQVAAGAAKAGRAASDIQLVSSVFLITGPDERTRAGMRAFAREQVAFYASTPSYRVVLECHGWQEIGEQLSRLAAAKRWADMGALVSDEMLAAFAVEAPLDRVGEALRERYDGVLDHVCAYMPYAPSPLDPVWRAAVAAVRG